MIIEKNLSNYLYKLYKNSKYNNPDTIWVLGSLIWYCEGYEFLKMIPEWKDNLKGYCNCGNYKLVQIAQEFKEKLKKICPELE